MKKYVLALALLALPFCGQSQAARQIDSTAVFILDRMADIIGELEAVSFSVETATDRLDDKQKIETHYSTSNVRMAGPDKMVYQRFGNKGKHGFWFNGTYASMYSFKENNYVTLESPGNIIEMMDDLHTRFDFQFPAADFFYPSFTDDILADFNTLEFLGKTVVDGEDCFYIRATNENMHFQLWISSSNWNLPKRFIIIQKGKQNLRFESVFKDWDINPNLPSTIFNFLPPPNARLIDIMEKS
ncbi:DUF2092 domain-containing protein [uncultured Eudoraea sp.]|uniref:DUF2092 domain-containing protein n=1 Tax=uncultured Eudoraea sp. TaxID=1035614 RepID=UPI0026198136|nr:DUF2092 domain-containing protein [uncultured Eudoraea sp.]